MAAAPSHSPAGPSWVPGDHIIAALAPYLSFADHLVHRIVCRAWRHSCHLIGRRPPPFPWLMLPPPPPPAPAPGTPQRRVFYDIPGGRSYAYPVPASYRYLASRGGWLVLAASDPPRRIVVLNPITNGQVDVSWPFGEGEEPTEGGFHAVMTASLVDPACFLAVAKDRVVKYCRPAAGRAGGWVTLHAQGFRFDAARSDLVSVGTTVYLVDGRRKLWRADLVATEPKVERRDTAFELPGGEAWRHYLVESLGHVLLVVSDEHHQRLGLYSLNWGARMWVPTPASGIGDTVLLLGRGCSAAVPASAAAGHSPGTVLAVRQPWRWSSVHMGLNFCRGQPWFWTASRLGAGLGDHQLALKKTVPQRPGEFITGDSFWFFPAIDESGCP
ncbi:hypothetical protein BS78_01G293400 [Paspalum vaginatum]|nr:hypothetical protein BS78_01G293400 [Paspalum vaginatum]